MSNEYRKAMVEIYFTRGLLWLLWFVVARNFTDGAQTPFDKIWLATILIVSLSYFVRSFSGRLEL